MNVNTPTYVVTMLYVKILLEITPAYAQKDFMETLIKDVSIWMNVNTHKPVDPVPYVKMLLEDGNVIVHPVICLQLFIL